MYVVSILHSLGMVKEELLFLFGAGVSVSPLHMSLFPLVEAVLEYL